MFCDKCGLAIPDDSINCPNCGKPAISDQPEQLQTPYFKSPHGSTINNSYERGNYFNLNAYIKDAAEHKSMPVPVTAATYNTDSEDEKKQAEAYSNRPLYIAIIAMISLIVIALISLVLRLTVLKNLDSKLETTSTVVSSCIIKEAVHAHKL